VCSNWHQVLSRLPRQFRIRSTLLAKTNRKSPEGLFLCFLKSYSAFFSDSPHFQNIISLRSILFRNADPTSTVFFFRKRRKHVSGSYRCRKQSSLLSKKLLGNFLQRYSQVSKQNNHWVAIYAKNFWAGLAVFFSKEKKTSLCLLPLPKAKQFAF